MRKLGKKAFTLIELLVVIAVVGILVLFGAPRFTGYTQKAELTRIQHDIKVMEQEVGTVLINNDDFNKWENNSKDFNQLIQEGKLFEKEGVAKDVDARHLASSNKTRLNVGGELHPISELPEDLSIYKTYKIIPEEFSKKINTKLKGTFYANNNGKVYYEHVKSLSGIQTEPSEPGEKEPEYSEEPEYSDEEIDDLVYRHDHIPVATAEELNSIRNNEERIYGEGTKWKNTYTGGLDKHYVQVLDIDLSEHSEEEEGWNPIGTFNASGESAIDKLGPSFKGIYDGGNYVIRGLEVKGEGEDLQGLFGFIAGATIRNVDLIDNKVTGAEGVGSLVGEAYDSTIENSYATGSVTGHSFVGGLVGAGFESFIENSYATGSVEGTDWVGGLVGYASDITEISNSYATGKVTVSGIDESSYAGGLVGANENSMISNSYATGSVEGSMNVGGLVGWSGSLAGLSAKISNSYATGSVTGTGDSVGGLVGSSHYDNKISNSYATGSVKGSGYYVGGLAGRVSQSLISNSYAAGSVTGTEDYVGGLAGLARSSVIDNSYATGSVTGPVEGTEGVGGLVGWAYGNSIEHSYWDTETTNQSTSADGIGKTTDEMKKADTYSAWNTYVWNIVNGEYPTLKNIH